MPDVGFPVQIFDVNALVALALTTHQHHRAAHQHLSACDHWATTPRTESALYRLLLNPSVAGRQLHVGHIDRVVRAFRLDPRWQLIVDDTSLASARVDTTVLMGHQQVTDLHLVNLAATTGAQLATFDAALPTWLAPSDRCHVVVIAP